MREIKDLLGVVAIVLTFVGYFPYLRDIIKSKTHPHIYTWFIWGFVSVIVFALQITSGGGLGSFVTLTAALLCIAVMILGLIKKSDKDITRLDTLFFIMALTSLGFWIIARQPVISAILATITDLLGFGPTIRKSWNKPHSETVSFYMLNSLRFVLATVSLQTYSIVTVLYPISWLLGNGIFGILLFLRRKRLEKE